jgi:hypothetical protein
MQNKVGKDCHYISNYGQSKETQIHKLMYDCISIDKTRIQPQVGA